MYMTAVPANEMSLLQSLARVAKDLSYLLYPRTGAGARESVGSGPRRRDMSSPCIPSLAQTMHTNKEQKLTKRILNGKAGCKISCGNNIPVQATVEQSVLSRAKLPQAVLCLLLVLPANVVILCLYQE